MTMPPTLLLDVDGTLAPFNQHAGTQAVTALLAKFFGNEGLKFGVEFGSLYDALTLLHPSEAIVVDDAKAVVISAVNFGFMGYVLNRAGHYNREEIESRGLGYITELDQLEL